MDRPEDQTEPTGSPSGPGERRLLYIAGYGRSGSTVLDIALSCHHQVEGLGELTGVFEALSGPSERLSPFWREVGAGTRAVPGPRSARRFRRAAATSARAERLLPGLALLPWSRLRARYRRIQGTLLGELFDRTGATVLVDSSKTSWLHTWRLPLLATVVPRAHCLVLVRDLGGVVRSVRRGHGETLEPQRLPTLRAVLGWTLSTASAVLVGRVACGRERIHLVRHERFVADPEGHLRAVYASLGLDDDRGAVAEGASNGFRPRHQILGNRVRSEEVVRVRRLPTDSDRLPQPVELLLRVTSRLVDSLVLRHVATLVPLAGGDRSTAPPPSPARSAG